MLKFQFEFSEDFEEDENPYAWTTGCFVATS